jgi:hypothetical protein
VERYAEAVRLGRAIGRQISPYQYDADVEAFFKHSPAVVRPAGG